MSDLTTVDDIRRAATHVRGVAIRTPLVRTATVPDLWLKPENLQPMGAFKIRGAMHALASLPVQAEKADRFKELTVEADHSSSGDLLNQVFIFRGNVVVTKGTMIIRAERIEVREGFVWARGHFDWRGDKYEWLPGHWERQRAQLTWHDGRWEQRGNVWIYIEGGWR